MSETTEKPVGLFLSGSSTPPRELPLALDSRYPKQVGGVDAFYNRKDVISTGLRTHPDTGLQFGVTPERMDKWVRNFRLMRERGVRVFLPNKHKKFDATDNNGWVLDLQREGDTLYSVEQLIGEDAKRNAARNDRSVYVQPNFKDDAGNEYDEAIIHVALCPNPVVSGLSEPVPLAASRNGPVMEALVLELNCGTGAGGFHEGNTCAAGGGEGERFTAGEKVSWTAGGKKFSGTVGKFVSAAEANTRPEETPLPPRTADTMSDAIAIASPSGRMSQRAKDAATKRLGEKLFGGDSLKGTDRTTQAERMRSTVANRRDMARLASPSQAKVILAEAEDLEAAASDPIGYYEVTDTKGKKRTVAHGRLVRSVSQSLSRSTPMTEAELTAIGEIIGADDVTDETAVPRLIDWGKQTKTDKATALSRVTAAEAERDAAKAQVLELSRTGNGPDPEVLHERGLRIMDKADSLSAAGILPPAFVDKFKKLLGGDKPRALLLSRDTGAADCPAGEFINLLAEFKPVMQFGEKTGAQQTLVLGRQAYGNAEEAGADEEAKKIDEFMQQRQAQRKTA